MGRPRKNKVGEYASMLADEITFHMGRELLASIQASQSAYRDELASLRSEVVALQRQVDALSRRARTGKPKDKIGRWVPGGPGRPPKDAAERVAAFAARANPPAESKKRGTGRRRSG